MSPRAKWIGAGLMLLVLAGIGVVVNRRASDEPVSRRALDIEQESGKLSAGDAGAGHR